MKKYTLLSVFFIFTVVTSDIICDVVVEDISDKSSLILLDQIEMVIFGQEDVEIITKSDIDRPALGGGYRTQDEIVFERSVLLDAKKHKIPQDEEAVDAGMAQMQREHNLSHEELENIFLASGYTFEEGRQQLQVMQTVNTMLDVKVRSNLIVPRRDVEQYYEDHPDIIESTYTLERLFIPFDKKMSTVRQKRILEKYCATGDKKLESLSGVVFTLNHSDVAESKQFIYSMEPGQVSSPQEVEGGFELLRLVEKTPEYKKTLDEMYHEIVDILRRPKYEELMHKYRDQLMKNVSIIYL